MDNKLYPPIIEGAIPAFYGSELKVPYVMNRSVSESQVTGFALKIKPVQITYTPFTWMTTSTDWDPINNVVTFILPNDFFTKDPYLSIGQFYKIQIAYIGPDKKTIGYYSTVGVVKYTSEPSVSILEPFNGNTYYGIYSQYSNDENELRDYNEKVYSYCFTLKDSDGNVIETSGEKLHNSSNDTSPYESRDEYTLKTVLQKNKMYQLDYSIKTINGLTKTAQKNTIFSIGSIDSKLKTKLKCELNYENGYIDISLAKPDDVKIEEPAVGSFYLLRASDEDDYNTWHEVLNFVLYGQQPSRHLWRDMTIKQGVKYKYAIQQFNQHNLKSNKIESEIIKADFEHAFLYDGERQLKIKYNPKINSFKTTLLESKIDTIGSKHPFIFRNGNVGYKEFPISGLISYLSDENDLFYSTSQNFNETDLYRFETTVNKEFIKIVEWISEIIYLKNKDSYYYKDGKHYIKWMDYIKKEHPDLDPNNYNDIWRELRKALNIEENTSFSKIYQKKEIIDDIRVKTTNLTSNNICLERNFKLEVLEWLNNGKPKLFRSPTEGNYIVRLMNVSLTPSDQLGRMIHTFNTTAYEIAENNYTNLGKYNFIKINNVTAPQLRWLSIDLSNQKIKNGDNLLKFEASSIYLEDFLPGEKFQITTIEDGKEKTHKITIGATGRYIIDLKNNVKIQKLFFIGDVNNNLNIPNQGIITYSYYSINFQDSFDFINSIENKAIPCQQFVGEYENIIAEIENVKDKIDSIGFIRFSLRDDNVEVYRFNTNDMVYYSDKKTTDESQMDLADLTNIYKVNILNSDKEIIGTEWVDGQNKEDNKYKVLDPENTMNTKIIINESDGSSIDIDIKDTTYYELRAVPDIASIQTGAAIITEICYFKKTIVYDLENSYDNRIVTAKDAYEKAYEILKDKTRTGKVTSSELREFQDDYKIKYFNYTDILKTVLDEAERR